MKTLNITLSKLTETNNLFVNITVATVLTFIFVALTAIVVNIALHGAENASFGMF